MKVSLNWVRMVNAQWGCAADPAPDGIDKLVEKIGAQLGAVEEVIDVGKKYEGILVVKIISCKKHPNADKLNVCLVDDGSVNKKVKRNNDGLIEIVCGAPNARAGILAAWVPPGNTVPSTFDKNPFVLEAREIRGIVSNGMLASLKELAIGDDHTGIVEIDKTAKPGESFAQLYKMDDFVIDIENKMFTHRPDLFGILGIARELAGIQGFAFKSPDWYKPDAKIEYDGRSNGLKLTVKNELPKLVPRFCAVVIKDIKIAPSPIWLRASLSRVGIRPINNIVDLTNFYMYLTSQPLHAYDYDKVKTGVLGVRLSKKGEKIKLLGGKQVTLGEEAVVITDGLRPIGLGGVMGGAETEVDESTKNIILECATFDMNTTRKTMMKYGLFTDAGTRFTKGQSPLQNMPVLSKATEDIKRLAGGRVTGAVVDSNHVPAKAIKRGNIYKPVTVATDFINSRLGLNLTTVQIIKLLRNVEFQITSSGKNLTARAPFWRTDIEIPEDIVEEVGRLYGYDHLPLELPRRDLTPTEINHRLAYKQKLRNILRQAGANEVLTYSFVPAKLLQAVGQDKNEAYHIRNALSPDLQYYRLSLAPSLLEKVHPNVKAGFDNFCLFEVGKSHLKNILDGEKLPVEFEFLASVFTTLDTQGAAYYHARYITDYLFSQLGLEDWQYMPMDETKQKGHSSMIAYYNPERSALISSNGRWIGLIGEPTASVRQALKLPKNTAIFELEIPKLYEVSGPLTYKPVNRFPSITQDICLRLESQILYSKVEDFIWEQLDKISIKKGYQYQINPIDIFKRPKDKNHKQITWRITLSHSEKTLTTEEANKVLDELAALAKAKLKADRV